MSGENVGDIINGLIAQSAGIPLESLQDPERRLDDLGMDSLGVVELLFDIEEKYGVRIDDPLQLKDYSLGQLHALVASLMDGKAPAAPAQAADTAAMEAPAP